MAHPRRRAQAEQLQRGHPELGIDVAVDPDPTGKAATLRTAKLAWSKVRPGATHHLVLQDDVLLCRDFAPAMTQALQVAPEGAVSLFANWATSTAQALRLAALAGASWTPAVDRWTPTQALVLPAAVAARFADYAERCSESTPDNVAMAGFLAEQGLTTYVSIPNLVEHGASDSLLFNDLLFGIRDSTVFAGAEDLGAEPFTGSIVAPSAVAHLGLGDFGALGHFERLGPSADRSWIESHEILIANGMSTAEMVQAFSEDLPRHPEAGALGFSESLLFHLWITMFVQGIIARGILGDGGEDFDTHLKTTRWTASALETFAAGALRRTCPRGRVREVSRRLTPLCVTAMRSGFVAVDGRVGLRNLWGAGSATEQAVARAAAS
jgi:hypothetical protein